MNKYKVLSITVMAFILISLLSNRTAIAGVTTNVWVDCSLNIIQTGVLNGESDTRLNVSATNSAFSDTWLIVEATAAKMVAATALTAYSLDKDIRIHIVPHGTGYRIDAVRILP